MPKVNVYIRKDDFELWKSITDKPRWLHEHLSLTTLNAVAIPLMPESEVGFIQVNTKGRPVLKAMQEDYCEHYQLKGACLTKGCKYAR